MNAEYIEKIAGTMILLTRVVNIAASHGNYNNCRKSELRGMWRLIKAMGIPFEVDWNEDCKQIDGYVIGGIEYRV